VNKKKIIILISTLLGIVLVLFLVIWLNLPWRPDVTPFHTDGGFYAYFGKAILHGEIPYRDVWDDKPPLGYYLNALGQLIFGQNAWGVWWSGVVWILGCTLLLFVVIKKLFAALPACLVSIVFLASLMNPQLFEGANLMEVYSLAPQAAVIGVMYLYFTRQHKSWFVVAAGVLTALAFLIKQPTIVLGCASILMMTMSSLSQGKMREIFRNGLGFLLGFVGMLGLVAMYWLSTGTLNQFIDGALLQGFSFMGGQGSAIREYFFYTLVYVLPNLLIGKFYLIALFSAGVFLFEKLYRFWLKPIFTAHLSWAEWSLLAVLVIAPWVARGLWPSQYMGKWVLISIVLLAVYFLVKFYRLQPYPIKQQVFSPLEWTWLIGVAALPLEVLMASLGGRYFGHYFISLLPAVTLVIAYPIWRAVIVLSASLKSGRELLRNLVYLALALGNLALGVFAVVQVWPAAPYREDLSGIFRGQVFLNDLEKYVIQTTQPDDEVLVWHIHLGINFNTDRKAPSRFLFPLNLFIPPGIQNTKLKEFLDDIEGQPPQLILVQKVSSLALPFVDEPADQLCDTYCTPEFVQALQIPPIYQKWLRFRQFFMDNYVLEHRIYDWTVYRKLP
jgi:4-amino-4-deoxy-L-arabinose transferase-like glycosyltransferase